VRELVRHVQELRKKLGLVPEDKIFLTIDGDSALLSLVELHLTDLTKSANVQNIVVAHVPEMTEVVIDGAMVQVSIAKL
jgi:hypothetical protein